MSKDQEAKGRMDLQIILGALVAGSTACILALLYRNLSSSVRVPDVDVGRLNRFSVARYRPDGAAFRGRRLCLPGGPRGFIPRIARQLRRERRRSFVVI